MKKQFVALIVLFFCSSAIYAEDSAILEAVEKSARAWLALADNGNYPESWREASTQFKTLQSEAKWIKTIQSIRAPLGSKDARYIAAAGYTKAPSGFSDGNYIMLKFYVTYSKYGLASESITLIKDTDETWRVAEYKLN